MSSLRKYLLALLLVTSTTANAGTWGQVVNYQEGGCNRVPPLTLCLSACAFAWLKGSKRINDGIVGFHFIYDPVTMRTGLLERWTVKDFLEDRGFMWIYPELNNSSPSRFVFIQGSHVWVGNWGDLVGYTMSSNPSALERCEL